MANYTILSRNFRGLNSPFKRTRVLDLMRRKGEDVTLLSETYLMPNDVQRMQNGPYKTVPFSGNGGYDQGGYDFNKTQLKPFN